MEKSRRSHGRTLARAAVHPEEWADAKRIPRITLRDWEQVRSEPDQPIAPIRPIVARDSEGVRRALEEEAGTRGDPINAFGPCCTGEAVAFRMSRIRRITLTIS
jgi:hypothetical protein